MTYLDLLIKGGTVADGSGAKAMPADIAVTQGRIVDVGVLPGAQAHETIDATDLVVAPGFIDMHAHADLASLLPKASPARTCRLLQGITTEVVGNCGFGVFPVEPDNRDVLTHLQTLWGDDTVAFRDLDSYADALNEIGLTSNLAALVGHGTLRASVMGFAKREPTTAELAHMSDLLRRCMDAGAVGLSSGLMYPPGAYARPEELLSLAKTLGDAGFYATHMRDEGSRVLGSIDESIEVASRGRVGLQISHHKIAGPPNWGQSEATLARLDDARASGVDVTLDVYPYTAGSTVLQALLPPWASEGGVEAMLARLKDDATLQSMERDIEQGVDGWESRVAGVGWENVVVAGAPRNRHLEGRPISSIAAESGLTPIVCVAQLLIEESSRVTVVIEMMDMDDVLRIMRWPHAMIGSDGLPIAGRPHPRVAGTFPRALAIARDRGLMTVEEAIRRMTSLPAQRLGFSDRGTISVGTAADLVVFDEHRVADAANYEAPLVPPVGITAVIVNGKIAARDGAATNVEAGVFVRPG